MASEEAKRLGFEEPRRAYRIIHESDGRVFYEGFTPETDTEISSGPTPPVLIQVDKSAGPYLYQVKDNDESNWRTVHEYP